MMVKFLSEKNPQKALWISQLSFAFSLSNGYFIDEKENFIFSKFTDLYESELFFIFRDEKFNDVNDFFKTFIRKDASTILISFLDKFTDLKECRCLDLNPSIGAFNLNLQMAFQNIVSVNIFRNALDYAQSNILYNMNHIKNNHNHCPFHLNYLLKNNCVKYFDVINKSTNSFSLTEFKYDLVKILDYLQWDSIHLLRMNYLEFISKFNEIYFKTLIESISLIYIDIDNHMYNGELQMQLENFNFHCETGKEFIIAWR